MKQLAAILLLGMLLFNWCGYRLIISLKESRASAQLEAQLDADKYDKDQLISVKIPVAHLAYYNSSLSYSRMDGQVTLGGIQYKYVERRIFNDTLEFLCIPDYAGMKLQLAGNDFCKKTGTHTGNSKIFSVDCHIVVDSFMSMEHYTVLAQPSSRYVMPILSSWASDSGQPPEHIS